MPAVDLPSVRVNVMACLVAGIVVYVISVAGRGAIARGRLSLPSTMGGWMHAFAIGSAILFLWVALLGFVGGLFPWCMWGWLLLVGAWGWRFIRADVVGVPASLRHLATWSLMHWVCAAVSAFFVGHAMMTAMHEPVLWDEVAYTLYLPKEFIRRNSLAYVQEYGAYSAFPAYGEMPSVAGLLLGFAHRIPHVLNVFYFVMVAFAAATIVQQMGVRRSLIPSTLVFVLAMPACLELAPISKNDLIASVFQLMALHALLVWKGTRDRRFVLLAGVYGGFALGVKYTSILPVALMALYVAMVAWSRRRERPGWAASVAIFGVASATLYLPWGIRNLVTAGNPVFPMLTAVFGGGGSYPFTALHARIMHEMTYGLVNFSRVASTSWAPLLERIERHVGVLPYLGLMVFAGLEWRRLRKPDADAFLVVWYSAALLVLWVYAFFWEPRYVLTLQVLLAMTIPLCVDRLPRPAFVVPLVMLGLLAYQTHFGYAYVSRRELKAGYRSWHAFLAPNRAPLSTYEDSYINVAVYLDSLPGHGRIATNLQPFYYLNRPSIHLHPMSEYGHFQFVTSTDELVKRLQELKVEYLAYHHDLYSPLTSYTAASVEVKRYTSTMSALITAAQREGRLRAVGAVGPVQVLAVPP